MLSKINGHELAALLALVVLALVVLALAGVNAPHLLDTLALILAGGAGAQALPTRGAR